MGVISHKNKIYYQSLNAATIIARCEAGKIIINKKIMGFSRVVIGELCKLLETDRKNFLRDIRDGKIIKIENMNV